jgi:hypothetical protein
MGMLQTTVVTIGPTYATKALIFLIDHGKMLATFSN